MTSAVVPHELASRFSDPASHSGFKNLLLIMVSAKFPSLCLTVPSASASRRQV